MSSPLTVLGRNASSTRYFKSGRVVVAEEYRRAFGTGLLSVEGQQWRRQRETLQPLFYREQPRG